LQEKLSVDAIDYRAFAQGYGKPVLNWAAIKGDCTNLTSVLAMDSVHFELGTANIVFGWETAPWDQKDMETTPDQVS
jgi:hypothetical protein